MQLGSAVSGVQGRLHCHKLRPQSHREKCELNLAEIKIKTERVRAQTQAHTCIKEASTPKIPAVHTAMVVCPTSHQHLQENCHQGFCCFLSGALVDGREMDTSLLVLGLFRNNTLIHFNVTICGSSEKKQNMDNVAYM